MINLEDISDFSQAVFDEYVVSGSDDELFASGYLRGHVDVVIGGALVQGAELTMAELIEQITSSINKAIKAGELEQNDIETVNQVLNKLIEKLVAL